MPNETLPTQLNPGDFAYVSHHPPIANTVRAEPSTDTARVGSLEPGTVMTVLEGPISIGENVWIKVSSRALEHEGWTQEVGEGRYYIEPIPMSNVCTNTIPSRLQVGDRAIVRDNNDLSNTVRSQPAIGSGAVGSLSPGTEMTITGTAQCDEATGTTFVPITSGDIVGWTGEGQGDEYWLEPVHIGVQVESVGG